MQGVAFHLNDEWEESSMTATIGVVVPTYNSATVIGQCLASLRQQSHPPFEIVVCDGGSTDETTAIAKNYGATVIEAPANRSAQRNTGANRATSEYIVFVDSDMRLTTRVLENCVADFRRSDAALVIPERDIGKSYWARVRGFERSFYHGVWWLQAARCYRRLQFLEIGGFAVGLVGPEDWDLDERIRQFGDVREIAAPIEHDEGRIKLRKLVEKKTHYASSLNDFKSRHPKRAALCLSGRRRVFLIIRRPQKLITHPLLTTGMVTLGITELFAAQGWLKRLAPVVKEQSMDASLNPLLHDDSQ
jgi:glycosyltransferase involved in cell wall biosynthesis